MPENSFYRKPFPDLILAAVGIAVLNSKYSDRIDVFNLINFLLNGFPHLLILHLLAIVDIIFVEIVIIIEIRFDVYYLTKF